MKALEDIIGQRLQAALPAFEVVWPCRMIADNEGKETLCKQVGNEWQPLDSETANTVYVVTTSDTTVEDSPIDSVWNSLQISYKYELLVILQSGDPLPYNAIRSAMIIDSDPTYRTQLQLINLYSESTGLQTRSESLVKEYFDSDHLRDGVEISRYSYDVIAIGSPDCFGDTCGEPVTICPSLQQVLADNTAAAIIDALEANDQFDSVCGTGCDLNTAVADATDAEVTTAIDLADKEVSILDDLFGLAGVGVSDIRSALSTVGKLVAFIQNLTGGAGDLSNLTVGQIQALLDSQLDNLTTSQLNGIVPQLGSTQWALLDSPQKAAIISILTGCEVSTSLPIAQKNVINYRSDSAWSTVLSCNNAFGNNNRFTDELGGQAYANDIVIDHLNNLYWYRLAMSSATHATAITNAAATTIGGVSGWRLPTRSEISNLMEETAGAKLDFSPFNYSASVAHWTNTDGSLSSQAQTYNPNANSFSSTAKTASNIYLICKTYLT